MAEATNSAPFDGGSALERIYKGPDGPKRVEQIVIRLLARLLAESNRSLEVSEFGGFDAVAPAGIDDSLPGPSIVDITHTLKRVKGPRFLPDLLKTISERGAKSVLLVATGKAP